MLGLFLRSKISGYLFLLTFGLFVGAGYIAWDWYKDYKDLQIDAAYCKGQLEAHDVIKSLQERAIDTIEDEADKAIKNITEIPEGCAAERVPDAILRYHGRLPSDDG